MNKKDLARIEKLAGQHTPERIRHRLQEPTKHSYLRDFVYGATDGAVTTFAIVSGVAGAGLSTDVVIILGVANLLGDGFSMAAANYLGTKTEEELRQRARNQEEQHIENFPEGEREEIRQIYTAKGFQGEELEHVVEVITSDKKRWVDTMLVEELGMSLVGPSAVRAALTTFFAFLLVGLIPLLSFLVNFIGERGFSYQLPWNSFTASAVLTAVAFLVVGMARSYFVDRSWFRSGIETLAIGGGAAILAYWAGLVMGKFI